MTDSLKKIMKKTMCCCIPFAQKATDISKVIPIFIRIISCTPL